MMGAFARLKSAFQNMVHPTGRLWLAFLPRTKFNYQREVGRGFDSSIISAALFWIMRTYPEAPVALEKDGELISDHPMLSLLRQPNEFYSGHIMEMGLLASFVLDGNAYLIKVRDRRRAVKELWYVPHWMMDPKAPKDGSIFISHYQYSPDGKAKDIDIDDVIHFRFGLDPQDLRKGMSALRSLLREIFTDEEAANFTASLLRNQGVPGIVVSPESDMGALDTDADAVKEWFKEKFSGDRRGEALVMKGPTRVEQFGFDPQKLDLAKLREIPEERVASVLGIPAAVLGFGSGLAQTKVGATMAELREMAYESCIVPLQRIIASELQNHLLPEFETGNNFKVVYDLTKVRVLQEDQNRLAQRVVTLVQGSVITVADGQRALGLEVDDSQDVYLRSPYSMPVPRGESPQSPAAAESGSAQTDGGNGKAKGLSFFLPAGPTVKSEQWYKQLVERLFRDWIALSGIFSGELEKAFDKLGEEAERTWRSLVANRGIELLSAEKPETKEEGVDRIYAELVSAEISTDMLAYGPHYLRVGRQTVDTIKIVTGLAVNLSDQSEIRIVASGGTRQGLVDVAAETRAGIFRALAEAREAGEGPYEAAARIRDQVAAGPWSDSATRSKVIARTETKYAQNVSSIEAYRSSDTITALRIIDGVYGPPRSDDECIARDGKVVSFEEAESIAISEHPNGTLSFAPVVGGAS